MNLDFCMVLLVLIQGHEKEGIEGQREGMRKRKKEREGQEAMTLCGALLTRRLYASGQK